MVSKWQGFINVSESFSYKDSLFVLITQGKNGRWNFMTFCDVHHGNYNPSCKAKSNMQEDSDDPMTRARAKQLQRALTS
jgi:hypothetical protein